MDLSNIAIIGEPEGEAVEEVASVEEGVATKEPAMAAAKELLMLRKLPLPKSQEQLILKSRLRTYHFLFAIFDLFRLNLHFVRTFHYIKESIFSSILSCKFLSTIIFLSTIVG